MPLVTIKSELRLLSFYRHEIHFVGTVICQNFFPSLYKTTHVLVRPTIKNLLMPQIIKQGIMFSLEELCIELALRREAVMGYLGGSVG